MTNEQQTLDLDPSIIISALATRHFISGRHRLDSDALIENLKQRVQFGPLEKFLIFICRL